MLITGLAFIVYGVILLLTKLSIGIAALLLGVVVAILAVFMGERFPTRRV